MEGSPFWRRGRGYLTDWMREDRGFKICVSDRPGEGDSLFFFLLVVEWEREGMGFIRLDELQYGISRSQKKMHLATWICISGRKSPYYRYQNQTGSGSGNLWTCSTKVEMEELLGNWRGFFFHLPWYHAPRNMFWAFWVVWWRGSARLFVRDEIGCWKVL